MMPGQPLMHALSTGRATLDPARARDAGRALGRVAVLRARLGLGRQPQPEHVHADRARRRRGVRLQRGRDARAGSCSRPSFRTHGGEVAVYFEAAAVIVVLVLLGQVLELRARSRTSAAITSLLGLAPKTARRIGATAARGRAARARARRRSAARAARRAGPGRRRRARRHDASTNRWSPASRSRWRRAPRRKVTGGTVNGTGQVRDAGRARRQRHAARADRPHGGRGAAKPRARSSGWPTSSPGASCRRWSLVAVDHVRRLGGCRPGAATGACARQCGGGADHRVPVRARPGDADVDHGRHRRAAPRLGVLVRNAEALEVMEKVDTLVVDKTGTLTEGKPTLASVVAARAARRRRTAAAGREPRARERAPARRRRSSRARASAASLLGGVQDFASVTGKGVTGIVDGRTRRGRQPADAGEEGGDVRATRRRGRRAARARGRR